MAASTMEFCGSILPGLEAELANLHLRDRTLQPSLSPASELFSTEGLDAECPALSTSTSISSDWQTENNSAPSSPSMEMPDFTHTLKQKTDTQICSQSLKPVVDFDVVTPRPVLYERNSYLAHSTDCGDDEGYEVLGKYKPCLPNDLKMKEVREAAKRAHVKCSSGSPNFALESHLHDSSKNTAARSNDGASLFANNESGPTIVSRSNRPAWIKLPSLSDFVDKRMYSKKNMELDIECSSKKRAKELNLKYGTALPGSYLTSFRGSHLPLTPGSPVLQRVVLQPVACLDTPSPMDDLPSPICITEHWRFTRGRTATPLFNEFNENGLDKGEGTEDECHEFKAHHRMGRVSELRGPECSSGIITSVSELKDSCHAMSKAGQNCDPSNPISSVDHRQSYDDAEQLVTEAPVNSYFVMVN